MLNNISFKGFRPESLKYAQEQFNQQLNMIKKKHPKDYNKSLENINYILNPENSLNYDLYFKKQGSEATIFGPDNIERENAPFVPNLYIKDKRFNTHELSIFNLFEYHNDCYSRLKEFFTYFKN